MKVFAISFVLCSVAAGQEAPEKIPLLPIKVKVVDLTGGPIPGAKVKPLGLRTSADPGSHYGWVESLHGKPPERTTNDEGIVEMVYPKFVHERMPTSVVTWYVDHPDYVVFYEDRGVDDDVAVVELKNGYRIAVTALGLDGKRVTENLFAIQSGSWGGRWQMKKGGVLTSRVFDRAQSALRLVSIPDEGPPLFSKLKLVNPDAEKTRVFLRNVQLEKGCVLEGAIDKAVPRPIRDGKVVAVVVSQAEPAVPGVANRQARWTFSTGTQINPDGTFRFESLPTGEIVQLIAICDGWVSTQPDLVAARKNYPKLVDDRFGEAPGFRLPQLVALSGETVAATIGMARTGSLEITLKTQDGKPAVGVKVGMWPNQMFFRYGSQVLGTTVDAFNMMKHAGNASEARKWVKQSRFEGVTDESGVVTIRNLPPTADAGFSIDDRRFDLPQVNGRRVSSATINAGQTTRVKGTVQPKGTDKLGQ